MKLIVVIFLLAAGCGAAAALTREYIFNTSYLNWQDAQTFCRKNYKDLATITSIEENNQLLQSGYANIGTWIGLSQISDTWTWSDGEQTSYLNWYHGSPSGWGDCTVIYYYYQGCWVYRSCTDKRPFYCYRYLILVNEMKTWEEALQYCRTHYTGLASVTSESSLQQLKSVTLETQTQSVWTGLHFVDGQWFWVSGEQLGSLVSVTSCPAPSYRCGTLDTTTNTMKIQNCNDTLNFICYWS